MASRESRPPNPARVLCVGSFALNDTVYADGRTSMADAGGNALYAAVGGAIWSRGLAVAAVVGPDWPSEHTQRLAESGVDVSRVEEGPETLRAWTIYESDGARRYLSRNRAVVPHTPNPYAPSPSSDEIAAYGAAAAQAHRASCPGVWPADALSAFAVVAISPMPADCVASWAEAASAAGATVVVDIPPFRSADSGSVSLDEPTLARILAATKVFMPSEAEARSLGFAGDAESFCRTVAARGPRVVGLKLGATGVAVYDRMHDRFELIPSVAVEALDSTGAGDAFVGGLAAGLAEGADPFRAARMGTSSAAHVIEAFGGLHALGVSRHRAAERADTLLPALPDYVCAIIEDGDQILMESRPQKIRHAAGKMTCFGGRREPGETAERCLERELFEELQWKPESVERAVDLFVEGRLIAWFYRTVIDVPISQLVPEDDREVVRIDPKVMPETVSPWHRAVITAYLAGASTAELAGSESDTHGGHVSST